MEMARAHLFIDGRVQGVFYRAFTREIAHRLGLSGWARNLRDGKVEAVFEGEKKAVQEAIRQCYTGPPGAQVTAIDTQWEPSAGDETGFRVRY
jgi:acylphosphatase